MKRHALQLILITAILITYASENHLCTTRLSLETAQKFTPEERKKELAAYQEQLERIRIASSTAVDLATLRNTLQWNVMALKTVGQLKS